MNSKNFIRTIRDLIIEWLNNINQLISNGDITISGDYSYNHILRVAESSTHFICELCGSKNYEPNQVISIKAPNKPEKLSGNTTSYFWSKSDDSNQEDTAIRITSKENVFSGLALGLITTKADFDSITKTIKLPIRKAKIIANTDKFKIPIVIAPEADYLLFNDIELFETNGICVHYKIMPSVFVIRKPVDENELQKSFEYLTRSNLQFVRFSNNIVGINTGLNSSVEHFADQLFSLSTQNTKEAIIDSFIQEHANYFAKALGYKSTLSQKKLKWVRRKGNDPDVSIPDFLMEREDGYYDILDIKTGATKYKSITKSRRSGKNGKVRMRFIDYASELIAQLKDYERYFSFEDNIKYAYETYGIKIKDLKLIGIIGNFNNFDRDEVDNSLDKENVLVFSYYDISDLLKKSS
jgi:hypothetical protein